MTASRCLLLRECRYFKTLSALSLPLRLQPVFAALPVKEFSVDLSRLKYCLSAALVVALAARGVAAVPSEALLPATTKGFISTQDVDEVRKKFNATQLGDLVNDPVMKPFIEDFKKQIGAKLERAGKKLGVKWEDLEEVYGGEVALALIQPNPQDKMSHATALIVDITGKRAEADELLRKVDANQRANRGVRSALKEGGVDVTVYTQPLQPGERVPERAFYFIANDQLVVADDQATISAIIKRLDGKAKDSLATVRAFDESLKACAKASEDTRYHIRWFVEPFGYAEASRAAQGGKKKRGTDLLKILQTQGFTAVQGLGGHVFFDTADTEVLHRTYAYAPPVERKPNDASKDKWNLAMRMLDFPNSDNADGLEPQPWALPEIATYLSFNWKMQEAFDYSETLVDAIIGDKGAFDEIWQSLKIDPNGPKIDIRQDLLNHLGTRATLLTDVQLPVDVKSERLMAFVEVQNKRGDIIAQTLEKAFKSDPQAKRRVIGEHVVWEIIQEEELALDTEIMIEGTGFVSTTEAPKEQEPAEEEAKLPNMAMTVFLDHLVISTHVDFIKELIEHGGNGKSLGQADDYQRVRKSLVALGTKNDSFHFFSRTDESYRATYELLQQGKLPEAETILARLLNSTLGAQGEGAMRKQEIDGSKLPNFDLVKKYLGPAGVFAQTEEGGWWVVGCLLKKQ
jgi:hypothetical protein